VLWPGPQLTRDLRTVLGGLASLRRRD
jgi:hypothetical protein